MCCRSSWPPCFHGGWRMSCWGPWELELDLLQAVVAAERGWSRTQTCTHLPTFLEGSQFRLPWNVCWLWDGHPGNPAQTRLGKAGEMLETAGKGVFPWSLRCRAPRAGGQKTWETQRQLQRRVSIPWWTQVPGSQRGDGLERHLWSTREMLVFCPDLCFVGIPVPEGGKLQPDGEREAAFPAPRAPMHTPSPSAGTWWWVSPKMRSSTFRTLLKCTWNVLTADLDLSLSFFILFFFIILTWRSCCTGGSVAEGDGTKFSVACHEKLTIPAAGAGSISFPGARY